MTDDPTVIDSAPRGARRPASGPLAGFRVVDCSTVLAGPFCTMLLADLGADVVKVEPPEGDATRTWGPPWIGKGRDRTAAYYLAINRNKRSIRLDLRQPAGRDILSRLLETADVFVENFRPGGIERLGFDDASLERLNPGLVHCSISGYGRDGPDAGKLGYDFVLQAVAGLMSITGFPDEEGGGPTKVGVAISDVATGLFGAVGVLAAIVGRASGDGPVHGRGQRVDVSILESTLAVLVNQAQNAFVTGHSPKRRGNAHPSIVPYETFATNDGELAVAVGSERQWARFCEALGLPELAADARFRTNGERVATRVELREALAARFATDSTAAWIERLEGAEVPCGPINDVVAAFHMPQVRARDMLVTVDHPALGPIRQVGVPIKLSGTPAAIRTAPPLLGEHSAGILAELGYDRPTIDRLRDEGVI